MKLIIKEYLSSLKESKELDVLIPNLLLSMGIEVLNYPQSGLRQYGVDVLAFDGNNQELLIFTIKQGDIGRSDWDSGEQSVRQSLNDIKDVYISTHIESKYSSKKKKIIVSTGGELKQSIQQNWSGYVNQNPIYNAEYEFWGGDRLALLIEEHMLNEHILPQELQSLFRRSLVLLDEPDYDLSDVYKILNSLIVYTDFGDLSKSRNFNKLLKSLRTLQLSLNIIFQWSFNNNNIKPSVLIAERAVLTFWEFIRKNNLFDNNRIIEEFGIHYHNLLSIYIHYFNKIQKHIHTKDGLYGYGRNTLLENLNIFEQLGILSTANLMYYFDMQAVKDNEPTQEVLRQSETLKDGIKALLLNHLSTNSPFYDNHINEITQAILVLCYYDELDFIDKWIKNLTAHIFFAYMKGKHFPIQSDSYDDLISLNTIGEIKKEKLMQISTLLPVLAQLCCVLDLKESYQNIKDTITEYLAETTLQVWYPDETTDNYLYITNAGYESGFVDAPITIPDDIEEMKKMMCKIQNKMDIEKNISSVKIGMFILPIIASRHYRTPMLPIYWQSYLKCNNVSDSHTSFQFL